MGLAGVLHVEVRVVGRGHDDLRTVRHRRRQRRIARRRVPELRHGGPQQRRLRDVVPTDDRLTV